MALILIACALLLAGLGYALLHIGAEHASTIMYIALAAAGLEILAAVAALVGLTRRRTMGIVASAGGSIVLLYFAIASWVGAGQENVPIAARVLTSGMLLLTVLTTTYLAHAERSDDFYYGSGRRP